jgi:alpha-galactosidase
MIRPSRFTLLLLLSPVVLSSARAAADEKTAARAWASQSLLGKTAPGQTEFGLESGRPPFSFVYDGTPSSKFLPSWKATVIDAPAQDGRERHTVTYTDPATGLQVVCEVTQFTDFPAVEWVMHFRNNGSIDTPIIEEIRPLDVGIGVPADGTVVLHHSKGSTAEETDFLPIDEPLPVNADINLAPNGGRSSDGVLPFFNLQWKGGGVLGAIGWSGQWAMRLRREQPDELTLQAGQQTTHFTLHPGETVRTPRILLVMWQGDDQMRGHNLLRRLLVAHYLPKRNGEVAVAPTACISFLAFNEGNGVNEENQLAWIKQTATLGAECYWLDAGWFEGGWPNGAGGDWTPDPKRFPRGLKPLGDAAHKEGVKFLLWFGPEQASATSRVAKEHPGWVMHAGPGAVNWPGTDPLNLGNPATQVWLTDYLSERFEEWGVDVFRTDLCIDFLHYWKAADAPDRQGITEIRHIEGLYQWWDEMVRRRPGLMIDNCASGGRRLDLETISRSYPLWRSDSYYKANPTLDQAQTAGLSLYLPQHAAGVWKVEPYAFRSAATTGAPLLCDVRAKEFSPETTKRALAEVKELRPCYFGDYYPLFPINASDEAWCGWQFDRSDLSRGFAMFFRRPKSAESVKTADLRGLDAAATYEVTLAEDYESKDVRTMSAAELGRLSIKIDSAPGSVLIKYRKLEQ